MSGLTFVVSRFDQPPAVASGAGAFTFSGIERPTGKISPRRELSKRDSVSAPAYGAAVARMHYEVPDELHRRCKAAAARQGRTLKDFLLAALEAEAQKAEREP